MPEEPVPPTAIVHKDHDHQRQAVKKRWSTSVKLTQQGIISHLTSPKFTDFLCLRLKNKSTRKNPAEGYITSIADQITILNGLVIVQPGKLLINKGIIYLQYGQLFKRITKFVSKTIRKNDVHNSKWLQLRDLKSFPFVYMIKLFKELIVWMYFSGYFISFKIYCQAKKNGNFDLNQQIVVLWSGVASVGRV